ncbi:MAG: type IV conjugative transfer system coupling protein TraD [Pedobacter sp.]
MLLGRPKCPIEALLRPPVELYSAWTAWTLAVISVYMPGVIMMTPGVAYVSAAILLLIGMRRFLQGYTIYQYHRNLVKLPYYGLKPRQIPVSNRHLFLGMGFKWTQKHTQRLEDALDPVNEKFLEPGIGYRVGRIMEEVYYSGPYQALFVKPVAWLGNNSKPLKQLQKKGKNLWLAFWFRSILAPLPPVGGKPAIHAVGMLEGESPVVLPLGERVGHTLVMGTTRVGKTRLAEILITQDIRRGDVTIVFDPKGDADLMMRCKMEAERSGRPFFNFNLGFPEISARYNGVGNFSKITEPAGRLTDALPSEGNSAAFKEFGWRFANIVIQAEVALGNRPHYQRIRRFINNIEPLLMEYGRDVLSRNGPEGWDKTMNQIRDNLDPKTLPFALKDRNPEAIALLKTVEQLEFYDPVLDGLLSAFKYDRSYFDKIVSSLGPLLEKLTTGRVADLIAPNYDDLTDHRPIFDWMSVIRQEAVVYVGLDALSDTTIASAVGASMFADLTSVSGFIYKHGIDFGLPPELVERYKSGKLKISLHADEFNELVGDQFIPMVNKAGGSGFQITAYTQTVSDIEARIGSTAKSGQIQGNFNNLIMLRVKEPKTAEVLTLQLPKVRVTELMQVSGSNDSSNPGSGVDFTSKNEDRISTREVEMISTNNVISLPKGQAFALIEGGNLYKIRMPMPEKEDDPNITTDFKKAYDEMKARYTTGEGLMTNDNVWLDLMDDMDKVAA